MSDDTLQPAPPKWLRAPAAALFLGEDVNAIYRRAQRGDVEAVLSLDGKWWINRESLEKLKARRESQSAAV